MHVSVGGETGREARVCDYEWVLDIRKQCETAGITFWFKNTGSFFKRDGVVQKVNPFKQNSLAKDLGINILGDKKLFNIIETPLRCAITCLHCRYLPS